MTEARKKERALASEEQKKTCRQKKRAQGSQESEASTEALTAAPPKQNPAAAKEFLNVIGLDPNATHSSAEIDRAFRAILTKMLPTRGTAFFNEQLQIFNALRLAATSQVQSPGFALRLEAPKAAQPTEPVYGPQVAEKT